MHTEVDRRNDGTACLYASYEADEVDSGAVDFLRCRYSCSGETSRTAA